MAKKDYLFFGVVGALFGILIMIKFADFNFWQFWTGFIILIASAYGLWRYGTN